MNFFTQSAVARPSKLYTRARDRIGQPHILRVLEPVSLTLSAALVVVATFSTPFIPTVTLLKIYIDTQMNSGNGTVNVGGNSTAAIVRWTTAEATVGLWGYCSKGVILSTVDNSNITTTVGAGCSAPGEKWRFDPQLAGFSGLSAPVYNITTGLLVIHMIDFILFVFSVGYWLACQLRPGTMDNISYAIFRTIRAHVRILIESLRKFIKKCSNPRRVVEYQESALGNVFDPNAPSRRDLPEYVHTLHKRAPRNLFLYFTLFSFFVFFLDIILGGIIQHNVKNLAAQESKTTGGVNFEGGNSLAIQLMLLLLQIWVVTLLTIDMGKTKEEYLKKDGEAQDTRTGEIS